MKNSVSRSKRKGENIIDLNVGSWVLWSEVEYMQERVGLALIMNERAKHMLEIINWCHLGSCECQKEGIFWLVIVALLYSSE